MISLLLVEDDKDLQKELKNFMHDFFDEVTVFGNADDALVWLEANDPDAIMSDICLPGMNGLEFFKRVRKQYPDKSLTVISAFPQTDYFIESIELKIHRFLIKPFDSQKLITEMTELTNNLKKGKSQTSNKKLQITPHFSYNTHTQECLKDGETFFLSKKEMTLLDLLAKNNQHYLTEESIAKGIWGDEHVSPSTIRALIKRLRESIGSPDAIQNIRGYGYRLMGIQ